MSDRTAVVRVWDLPIRLFHWLLVACIAGSFVTAKVGGFWMDWHLWFGHAALALLVFRLVWGVVGPESARFTRFVRGPRAVWGYLRGITEAGAGHTPLGALSVIAMLLVLVVQVVTGLFASDGIMTDGPLTRYVSAATSDTLTGIHQLNEPVILGLLGLHVLAVLWYALVRRRRIVRPMLSGDKPAADVPAGTPPAPDGARERLLALVIAALAAGLAWWIASLGGGAMSF